jgi:hypothetical protein
MKDPDMPRTSGPSDAGFTPTEFERKLLDSARADAIPPALKQSMQRALHASLASGATGAAVGTSLWGSKTGLAILLSTAALGSLAGYRLLSEPPAKHVSAPAPALVEVAPHASPTTQPPQPTAAEPALLRDEIALLDRARTALQARSPDRALDLLAQHAARFTQPSLGPEAEVLRIEALVQSGELSKARTLAKTFLAAHPHSPLAARVTKLAR